MMTKIAKHFILFFSLIFFFCLSSESFAFDFGFSMPDIFQSSDADKDKWKNFASNADETSPVDQDGQINTDAIVGGSSGVAAPFIDAIKTISQNIYETVGTASANIGIVLFEVFVGMWFVVFGARYYFSGGGLGMIAGDFLEFFFKALIPFLFLAYNQQVSSFILDAAYGVSSLFLGSPGKGFESFPWDDLVSSPIGNFSSMIESAQRVVQGIKLVPDNQNSLVSIATGDFNASNIATMMLVWLTVIPLALIYLFSSLFVVVQIMAAMVILPIALALGPLLSTFVIAWQFSGIFTSWLSLVFLGVFTMIISSVFARVFSEFSQMLSIEKFQIVTASPNLNNPNIMDADFIWANAGALALYSYVLYFLAKQSWSIGTALSGGFKLNTGSVGDNGGRGAAPAPKSPSSSGKTPSGGASPTSALNMAKSAIQGGMSSPLGAAMSGAGLATAAIKGAQEIAHSPLGAAAKDVASNIGPGASWQKAAQAVAGAGSALTGQSNPVQANQSSNGSQPTQQSNNPPIIGSKVAQQSGNSASQPAAAATTASTNNANQPSPTGFQENSPSSTGAGTISQAISAASQASSQQYNGGGAQLANNTTGQSSQHISPSPTGFQGNSPSSTGAGTISQAISAASQASSQQYNSGETQLAISANNATSQSSQQMSPSPTNLQDKNN